MGVTGTNGKTTTAFLVKHLLDADQRRCGLIGTVKYSIGDEAISTHPRTTPESVDLQDCSLAWSRRAAKPWPWRSPAMR